MSVRKKLGIALGVLVALGVIGQIGGTPTTGQKAKAESPQEKQSKQRSYLAYLSAKAVKESLRNPDSIKFESILANDDGSVICMTYRAENGFGGLNLEHVVFKDGEPSQTHASWRRNCAYKQLNDVTGVASMI